MQIEIEAKFLDINHDEIRAKLIDLGAKCVHPMRLMRRVVIDFPDRRMQNGGNSWIRVRDEGDKVTLTHKTTIENEFGGSEEIEVIVAEYEKTIEIFKAMGLIIQTEQESRRETWQLGRVEIVLDEWPWLNPFIEIEGPTQQVVKKISNRLGFDWKEAVFGSVITIYRIQYPHIKKDKHISAIPEIKFDIEKPSWFTKKGGKHEIN